MQQKKETFLSLSLPRFLYFASTSSFQTSCLTDCHWLAFFFFFFFFFFLHVRRRVEAATTTAAPSLAPPPAAAYSSSSSLSESACVDTRRE